MIQQLMELRGQLHAIAARKQMGAQQGQQQRLFAPPKNTRMMRFRAPSRHFGYDDNSEYYNNGRAGFGQDSGKFSRRERVRQRLQKMHVPTWDANHDAHLD
ncbi:unnamed protein product [Notodromas monacha]|uniref:Uncharacterized protein n=1 Tax=Notodromas monacha TaxID=399045 RepID=A0A7R9GE60_9CRUS|nr:unnamed protein product [Notodromas monacha]CAG0919418.1 unnamed protein product [Notodromas monacha]